MSAKKKKREIPAYERRLEEARNHIQTGNYRSAVESAGSGIELLIKELFEELRDKDTELSVDLKFRQDAFVKEKSVGTADRLTLGLWIEFYGKEDLFDKICRASCYKFIHFNQEALYAAADVRNKCVHKDYQPTKAEAGLICNQLAWFLEETRRPPQARQDNHWTRPWRQKWDDRVRRWRERNTDSQETNIVSALVDQLMLVVNLIGDGRVPAELKPQLMQAIVYVIDPNDFISESHEGVIGLVDDAAVLAFTLYWLDHTGIVDPATLREYWNREDDPIVVANQLYQDIVKNHKALFSDEVWAVIGAIAKKGPGVLWKNNLKQ